MYTDNWSRFKMFKVSFFYKITIEHLYNIAYNVYIISKYFFSMVYADMNNLYTILLYSVLLINKCKLVSKVFDWNFFSEGCSHLSSLDISWCDKVTDRGISYIANGCPKLKHLLAKGITRVSVRLVGGNRWDF